MNTILAPSLGGNLKHRPAIASRSPGFACKLGPHRAFQHSPRRRCAAPLPLCSAPSAEPSTATTEEGDGVGANPVAAVLPAAVAPEVDFVERSDFQKALTAFRLAFALPWRRFKDGAALSFKLGGAIAEQPQSRFSSEASLPAICDCLTKAAYDPRIAGIVFMIDPLSVGWAKVIEIRRHVELFRKSGKWAVAYLERAGEKEYFLASAFGEIYVPPSGSLSLRGLAVTGTFLRGVLDKVGIEPEVRRIGKFKSAGDQLLRTDMSEPQREQLSALLDDIYDDFVSQSAAARGKSRAEFESLLDAGVYDMTQFKEGGWVTDLKYEDELNDMIKARTGGKEDELRVVSWRRYSRVGKSALGLGGGLGAKTIAVVRTSGAIVGGNGGSASGTITAGAVISQLRQLKKDKRVAAVVLRVDSPGGDALASDLMWREIQQLSKEKPVVASMADVAASGGFYMAMACRKIVAEGLTITGSVGVVAGKFSLGELYSKVGYSKEIISRGRYAQLLAENRSFTEDEAALFDAAAQHAYESFRDKAAASRGMEIEAMQEVAQGRVWSGKRAATVGLVDALGGINRAIQLAKEAADIAADEGVRVLEVSRASFSPLTLLTGGSGAVTAALAGVGLLLQTVLRGAGSSMTPAAALGAPVLMQALVAVAGGGGGSGALSAADQSMVQGLAAGRVVAQAPEISVEGVASKSLLSGGLASGGNGGGELFDC